MHKNRIALCLSMLMALVFFLSACGGVTPQPPREPDAIPASGHEGRSTDKVALYYDNTRNTRGLVLGVDNSSFVKTIDQIYETMFNGWTGLFYALDSQLKYVPFKDAVDSRTWGKVGIPDNFKKAYKQEEFYNFSVLANGRGPLRRLVEDTQVSDEIINVFITDLIEQDNQSSAFARWLTSSLLTQDKNTSIIVLRIESKYNGQLSVPEEGTVSTDGGELQMIKTNTTSLPFFCVMQGPTDDLSQFCVQLTEALDLKDVAYEQTNILAHGGMQPIDASEVKQAQTLPMKTAGQIPIKNSNDIIYLTEKDPAQMFPGIEDDALFPNFGYALDSGRKEAALSFYVPLPDVLLPEGRLLRYALESSEEDIKASADVLLSIPKDTIVVQKGYTARGTEQPAKQEFRWEDLSPNIVSRHAALSKFMLATKDVPRYDAGGLVDRQRELIEKELGGTTSYMIETQSGALHIKLELSDLDALRKASGSQAGAKMIWLRIPVQARYVRNDVDESIFSDTTFGSFYGISQGHYGSSEAKAKWNAFWQTELVNLTVCIQL